MSVLKSQLHNNPNGTLSILVASNLFSFLCLRLVSVRLTFLISVLMELDRLESVGKRPIIHTECFWELR